jgi:hypothetical protein
MLDSTTQRWRSGTGTLFRLTKSLSQLDIDTSTFSSCCHYQSFSPTFWQMINLLTVARACGDE